MSEQRRDAHRGLAGLNQSWVAAIARARSRVRYMALCRRLLEVGMRSPTTNKPPPPAAAAVAAATVLPKTASSLKNSHPPMARRCTDSVLEGRSHTRAPLVASLAVRRSVSARELEADPSLPRPNVSVPTAASASHGPRDVSGGGNSAELRRLAQQIRCRGGKKVPVTRYHTPEDRKKLEVR